MNYRLLAKFLGYFALAIGVSFAPSILWAFWFGEWSEAIGLAIATAIAGGFGGILYQAGRRAPDQLYQREALGLVALAWIMASVFGALPYVCTGVLNPVDAVFESTSGFTTTGASVISDIPAVPKSVLFWRAFTHWLGGMGIVVLFIAVLPYLGAGGKQLFRSETTGPDPHGLRPRIKESAALLYKIYLGLTIAQTAALMLTGKMDFFHALCHTFGTLATGGFSTQNESIAFYDSIAVECIIIFFMIAAGTNFSLYFGLFRKQFKNIIMDTEWRAYLCILAVATILIAINLAVPVGRGSFEHFSEETGTLVEQRHYEWDHALRVAAFQSVSIMTTTGYATDDFDKWPHFSRTLMVVLMFVGGCAGSTGGGMKVVRIIMLAKMAFQRIESTFRPKTIRVLRLSGHVVDEDVQRMVFAFFVLNMFCFVVGTLIMSLFGLPLVTAATSVIATLNNIGPGLELVGATSNFAFIPDVGKLFLVVFMIMGRLELFTILVLFVPSFWRAGR